MIAAAGLHLDLVAAAQFRFQRIVRMHEADGFGKGLDRVREPGVSSSRNASAPARGPVDSQNGYSLSGDSAGGS